LPGAPPPLLLYVQLPPYSMGLMLISLGARKAGEYKIRPYQRDEV